MKGWRTLAFNLATAALGVIAAFDWTGSLPAEYAWAGLAIVSAANIGLRFITNTPIGKSA
jgi:hypothetical protein